MNIPQDVLEVIDKEETIQLIRLWDTDLYNAYLKKLRVKYKKIQALLEGQ